MPRIFLSLAAMTAAAIASAMAFSAAVAAERAGETTRVQPDAYQATGGYPLDLRRGDAIYRDASVSTRANGSVAMLFDDGTDLVLGPNTEVTIDEYVYAPGGGGRAAISFGKGVLRMVSGRMPDGGISIDTPVATVGIRGTAFTLALPTAALLRGWVEHGTVTATPDGAGQSYSFSAPAAFACTAAACEQVAGGPPPPATFPAAPEAGFGFGPGDRDGEDREEGEDSSD